MSRRLYKPLEVWCGPGRAPREINLENSRAEVKQILDCWCDTGCWWEGESEKRFYRVYCQEDRIYEIFQDQKSGQWFLYKIYD